MRAKVHQFRWQQLNIHFHSVIKLIKKRQTTFYRKPLYDKLNFRKRIRQKDGICLVHNFTDITRVLTNSYTTLQTLDGVTHNEGTCWPTFKGEADETY